MVFAYIGVAVLVVVLMALSFYIGFYLGFKRPEINILDKIHDYIDDIKPDKEEGIKQVETVDGKTKDARHFF